MKKMLNKPKKPKRALDVNKALHENPAADAVLRKLRSYLDTTEPDLVYFLVNLWGNQGKAITYKELREAILRGELNEEWLEQWRQDYSRFVTTHLKPKWMEAMKVAVSELEAKYPEWYFNPGAEGIGEWTQTRAAEFVTSSTNSQIEGLRALIHNAASIEAMNVDRLARAIRPMVGLYRQQAIANMNYYNKLIENGINEKKALDLSTRYAARQHRYRGYLIARQELAMAYNTGADYGVRQAQAKGYLGKMVKVWSTAADERTCDICGGLEGAIVGMDDEFNFKQPKGYKFTKLHPPAHYMCRCGVVYKEAGE